MLKNQINIYLLKNIGPLISACILLPCCRQAMTDTGIDKLNKDKTNIDLKNYMNIYFFKLLGTFILACLFLPLDVGNINYEI